MKDTTQNTTSFLNKRLIKNISILTSLLFLGIILMVVVHYYEKAGLEDGESTSAAQLLGR